MFRTLGTVEPKSASEQTAYSKWFDQRFDREAARADRLHGAEGVIPAPLWIVLFFSAGVIFIFMLFFADSAERVVVQATMMGGVAAIVTATLLLLLFLDSPYHPGVGSLRPTQMERTLRLLRQEAAIVGGVSIPCDSWEWLGAEPASQPSIAGAAPYSSSLTWSPQVAVLPSASTWSSARCVMKRLGAAPCQ